MIKYLLNVIGGTLDVTAHEYYKTNHIKEIYIVSGENCGGLQVNLQFQRELEMILSEKVVKEIKKKDIKFWIQTMIEFEKTKRMVKNEKGENFFIQKDQCRVKWPISIKEEEQMISGETIYGMIKKLSKQITKHLEEILAELLEIEAVILVGGFAKSLVLQNEMRKLLGSRLIIPDNSELCVIKGAVMFGQNKDIVFSRKSRFTYGFDCQKRFEDGMHSSDPSKIDDGINGKMAINCFHRLVKKNDDVTAKNVKSFTARHLLGNSKYTTINLYRSIINNNPMYCDENGVENVGQLKLQKEEGCQGQEIILEVSFGDTEIHLNVKDKFTGKEYQNRFDFLTKRE